MASADVSYTEIVSKHDEGTMLSAIVSTSMKTQDSWPTIVWNYNNNVCNDGLEAYDKLADGQIRTEIVRR